MGVCQSPWSDRLDGCRRTHAQQEWRLQGPHSLRPCGNPKDVVDPRTCLFDQCRRRSILHTGCCTQLLSFGSLALGASGVLAPVAGSWRDGRWPRWRVGIYNTLQMDLDNPLRHRRFSETRVLQSHGDLRSGCGQVLDDWAFSPDPRILLTDNIPKSFAFSAKLDANLASWFVHT